MGLVGQKIFVYVIHLERFLLWFLPFFLKISFQRYYQLFDKKNKSIEIKNDKFCACLFVNFLPRTLSEFWHWFVANIPGDSVDDGEVIFDLLFPLVLPEGDGDHRYVI